MRIGLLRRGYSATGGAEAYLKRFAAELAARKQEPVLLTGEDWPKEQWPAGPITRIEAESPGGFARECMKHRSECDVFFSLERVPGCDVFRAGDGVHKAWLRRRAQYDPAWKRWTYRVNPKHVELLNLEKGMFEENPARLVIVNSKMVRTEILEDYDYPADRIRLIYNGLPISPSEIQQDKKELRHKLNLPEDKTLALFVGSGWGRKGLRFAIRAINQFQKMHLVVAGRGDKDDYDFPNVHFLGPVSHVQELYAACDVFILPTVYDPFSNACLEAAMAGLPVITTSSNGFSEVILPGETGEVISRPDAIDEMAQALARWDDPARRNAAREKLSQWRSQFSIERNVDETLAAIESLPGL